MSTIRPEKFQELEEKMKALGLFDEDIVEKFILGSGRGGQKIQKTSSCVFLHHLPSGIMVKCQRGRSREANRFYARRLLIEKFKEKILRIKTEKQQEIEKIKRQKRKRSKRSKEKMLKEKKDRGEVKKLRGKPKLNGD